MGRVPPSGVSPQVSTVEAFGAQLITADSLAGWSSVSCCKPSKLHLATLQLPLVVLFEQERADQARDGRLDRHRSEEARSIRRRLFPAEDRF
jgi:hypothetical protein